MYGMMKRHEIQVLLRAGLSQAKVAELAGVAERTVRTVAGEEPPSKCFHSAESKFIKTGAATARINANAKCTTKFAEKWGGSRRSRRRRLLLVPRRSE